MNYLHRSREPWLDPSSPILYIWRGPSSYVYILVHRKVLFSGLFAKERNSMLTLPLSTAVLPKKNFKVHSLCIE